MRLSDWMGLKGLDDDQMAELCGVDRVTISRTRREKTRPSWDLAARIKAATNGAVTADDFLPNLEAAE